ncbi:hypothetical protein ACPWR0_05140 [Pandoraea pneumonica]|uniref:hypothetical protein n=1 Tax=Pandoraea pneumonica TaxID=2508299 RepID=UPI003CEA7CD9
MTRDGDGDVMQEINLQDRLRAHALRCEHLPSQDISIAMPGIPADAEATSPGRYVTVLASASGVVDGVAATLCGVSSQLPSPAAAILSAGSSAALWSTGALLAEASNFASIGYDKLAGIANWLSFSAGAAGLVATRTSENTASYAGYTSSALWGMGAVVNTVQAALDTSRNHWSRGFQMASGALNLSASVLSGMSVHAADNDESDRAAWYALASSAAWGAGSVMTLASVSMSSAPPAQA